MDLKKKQNLPDGIPNKLLALLGPNALFTSARSRALCIHIIQQELFPQML
jgi:hypothetical protein